MPCSRNGHLPPYSTQHSNSSDPHSYTSSPHKPLAFYFLFFFSTTVLYTFVKCNRKFFCQPVLFISPYSWSYSGCICSFSLASPLLDSFSYFYILRYFSLVARRCRLSRRESAYPLLRYNTDTDDTRPRAGYHVYLLEWRGTLTLSLFLRVSYPRLYPFSLVHGGAVRHGRATQRHT